MKQVVNRPTEKSDRWKMAAVCLVVDVEDDGWADYKNGGYVVDGWMRMDVWVWVVLFVEGG